jgi:hypothetical protein
MYEDELLEEGLNPVPPASNVETIISMIMEADDGWVAPDEALPLGSTAWRPHLVHKDRGDLLYVHLSEQIRPFLVRRLEAAKALGRSVHVALELTSLYDPDTLIVLGTLDAAVHLVGLPSVREGRHVLSVLADEGVPVENDARAALATTAWELRREGSNYQKGRRLEGLLAFLLSQVDDFRVRERNFRGETDEIDIVVQLDRISTRCWYSSGVPFILVEAKNWKTPIEQKEISSFIFKIQTKRGRCKIGLFFASGGFTQGAGLQELKLATTDLVVVLIGPSEIEQWISHGEPDEYLEHLVSDAMLR